jgi:phosphoribosyl 1,2-cyclic phosphate phosphodiesterase
MKIHFLGTAAAEGFPAIFCRCAHCINARLLGGNNIRTRSSAIIDDVLKIDLPPDTLHHVLRDGIDLCKVKNVFITHTHSDHLLASELEMRMTGYSHGCDHPLQVYGSEAVMRKCQEAVPEPGSDLIFRLVRPFETIETDIAKVTPLLANHDPAEICFIYYIEKDGKKLLYGHDTGWFPEQTWAWLEGKKLDLAILECTNGLLPFTGGHLNVATVLEIRDLFIQKSILEPQSKVVVTHFSHNIGLLHDDLTSIFHPHGIDVAYDGMLLEL